MREFYKAIWRASWRQQILLIVLSLAVAALAAAPLKFQKEAINSLIESTEFTIVVQLCAGYLGVILLSAALKSRLNYKISLVGEGVIRFIREWLYTEHVTDNAKDVQDLPKKGTLLTMISTEAEEVGSFSGSAIADPLMMVGTLVSVIGFIMVAQPFLGLIALGMILPQAVIVLAIQRRINARVKQRVQALRASCDQISGSDLLQLEDEVFNDFNDVFEARRNVFILKLSSKFILKVINACGTVGVLLLGGWLVIQGKSDVGTVVAALTGIKQISGPWLELVTFFRSVSTMRVRYEMIIDNVYTRNTHVPTGNVRL